MYVANWSAVVRKRRFAKRNKQSVAWARVVDDVRPFLEPSANSNLLARENLMHLLESPNTR